MTDTDLQRRNGLDVSEARQAAEHVLASAEPVPAVVQTRHQWANGHAVAGHGSSIEALGANIERGHHHVRTDLPAEFGGSDTAPTPSETLLTALAGCIVSTFVEGATLEGVDVDAIEVTTRTSLDLRGAYGVDGIGPGLDGIEVDLAVRTDVADDVLDALGAASVQLSPTADSITNPVPIRLTVRRLG